MAKEPVAASSPRREAVAMRAGLVLALLAAFSWIAAEASAAVVSRPVKDLTRSAEFIFRGTVQKTGAANLSIVEPNARTAIVRVDEVLKAGGTVDSFAGQEVTVFLSEALKAGDQRVFFTKVQLLGESLGVQEVGRASGPVTDLKAQVGNAKGEILSEDLAARLAGADLVVSGRVLSLEAADTAPKSGPISEHDPQWAQAVLEINTVLKGQVTGKTVAFWVPTSLDVLWASVPKPVVGQAGTWLLHRHVPENATPVLAILDPQDLLSADEATLAERLVQP